ncbi:MAG: patatin-like phospholipase family protein [Myxococcota bacterium]
MAEGQVETATIGLALSGGGSRAAAFHRGTLRALNEVGLAERLAVVSTVSGGSVFGAAWMAARSRGETDHAFLQSLRGVLRRGFVWPAILHWRALKVLLPGWSRTHRLAETFDELLLHGMSLSDLPERPLLCINATMLNHGAAARFSRHGFSGEGVGARTEQGHPQVAVATSLAFATAASAAFPFVLPPLSMARAEFGDVPFSGPLAGHDRIILTDGGILENLGAQTLLRSRHFGARHIVVSDAEVRDQPWLPTPLGRIRSAAAFGLSAEILDRLLVVMSMKQNRSMRQLIIRDFVERARTSTTDRVLLFARISQDWDRLLTSLPEWRLAQLGAAGDTEGRTAARVFRQLESAGIDLSAAQAAYDEMGGKDAAQQANAVATNFTALSEGDLDLLEGHARWQILALSAIFGGSLLDPA